jgi:hypothetical protein
VTRGPEPTLADWLARREAAAAEESMRSYEAGDQLMATWWDGKAHAYAEALERFAHDEAAPSGRPDLASG